MYLTETSAPTRGRPTETYLETVLLHKSPLVSGCTVTACVSWLYVFAVYMYLVCGSSQAFLSRQLFPMYKTKNVTPMPSRDYNVSIKKSLKH
jgi:hypothetical protein